MKKKLKLITALLLGMTATAFADCGKCEGGDCTEKLEAKFAEYDADKDGKLTVAEFKALVESCGKKKCADKGMKHKDMKDMPMEDEKKAPVAPAASK